MRSLTSKLTLAFLFVGLVGIVLAAAIIQWRTRQEFDRFLFRRETQALVVALSNCYQRRGDWQGCERILEEYLDQRRRLQEAQGSPLFPPPAASPLSRPPLSLAQADGVILFGAADQIGQRLNPGELQARTSIPIEVDHRVVGYLLAGGLLEERRPPPLELAFLRQVNRAILLSAFLSLTIALLLGILLARTLTHPIQRMTEATRQIARGALGYQVEIHSKDELGELARSLNRMSAELAKSTRLRKQMTADIAHDLRTPLSLILGYTEALAEGKLQGEAHIFTVLHKEASHLSRLVDDLRLISLADAGELPLSRQSLSPRQLLEGAANSFRSAAEQRGITLRVESPENLPPVSVDPERMAQVLGNLLSNALRYTPSAGTITLSAGQEGEHVVLAVSDSGAGIPEEDLPHIFNRFYRGDKARPSNGESGLGLTIAKSLVEAHGGQIDVTSQVGRGTTFFIRLPIEKKAGGEGSFHRAKR